MRYQVRLEEEAQLTFNLWPVILFGTIFPIVIGLLLRLPELMIDIKNKNKWTIDWVKIIAIGIPTLYIAILPLLSYTSFGMKLLFAKELVLLGNSTLITTAGIVFGYVLLDSCFKK